MEGADAYRALMLLMGLFPEMCLPEIKRRGRKQRIQL